MHEATRKNIKLLMGQMGLGSEKELAAVCGMSQSSLNRFMRGETEHLDFVNLMAIARHFDLTVSQLIGETEFDADPKIRVVTLAMRQMPENSKDVVVATSSALAQPTKANGTQN